MKKVLAVSAMLLLLIGLAATVSLASEIYTEIYADRAAAFSETLTTPDAQFNQSAAVDGAGSYLYVDQWAYTDWWDSGIVVEQRVEAGGCFVNYHQDARVAVGDAFSMTAALDIIDGQDGRFTLEDLYSSYSITEAGYDSDFENAWLEMRGVLYAEFLEGEIHMGHYVEANCCPIDIKYVLDENPRSGWPIVDQRGLVTPGDSYGFDFNIPLWNEEIFLGFLINDYAWCDWESDGGCPGCE